MERGRGPFGLSCRYELPYPHWVRWGPALVGGGCGLGASPGVGWWAPEDGIKGQAADGGTEEFRKIEQVLPPPPPEMDASIFRPYAYPSTPRPSIKMWDTAMKLDFDMLMFMRMMGTSEGEHISFQAECADAIDTFFSWHEDRRPRHPLASHTISVDGWRLLNVAA